MIVLHGLGWLVLSALGASGWRLPVVLASWDGAALGLAVLAVAVCLPGVLGWVWGGAWVSARREVEEALRVCDLRARLDALAVDNEWLWSRLYQEVERTHLEELKAGRGGA